MSNKPTSLKVPQQSQESADNLKKHSKSRSTTLSHLFHGTKKWGSFSKSTINKKKDAHYLHHSTDIDDDQRMRSLCTFFNFLPIFHPIGPLKCCWDAIVMFMLIYTSVEIPYTLAFQIDLSLSSAFGIIAFCIDICLCIDIILNFRTAYFDKFDHLKLIINPTVIAKKYLCGWFVIDLITSLPIEFLIPKTNESANNVATYIKMFRMFRLVRVIKILRLLKMVKLFDGVMKRLVVREMLVAFRLLKIISFMLLYAHFSACLWYYIGCESNSRYGISWISENTNLVTDDCGTNLGDITAAISPTFTRYSYAWYWSVVTLFTTGYGDIVAQNIEEQWTASVSILIGTCFFAYFIGTLTTLISEGDRISSEILGKMEEAQHFCDKKKLPREMARAVLTHTRYHCNYNCIWDETTILSHLPHYLQMDISLYVARTLMLGNIDFFNEPILDPEVRGSIALKMRSISCNNGYKLYNKGDLATEIYIQRTGKSIHLIETKMGKKKRIQLNRGDVCGEYSLILKKRASTILCATWCEFYVIDINDIIESLQQHYGNRWEKKWTRMKKCVKKDYIQPLNWKKKRHLKLQRNLTPSVYSSNEGVDISPIGENNMTMHGIWKEPNHLPSIRSTIRSEEVASNMMFQHILQNSDLNNIYENDLYSNDHETEIKHDDIGISISIVDEDNNMKQMKREIAENDLVELEAIKNTISSNKESIKQLPFAKTMKEADLQQNNKSESRAKKERQMLENQRKAKSFDEHYLTTSKEKDRKSPMRWLDSIRTSTNSTNEQSSNKKRESKKRDSKKKKKSVWFGLTLTRQNSELRDQAVIEDTLNIDKLRHMFSDYHSDSGSEESVPAISRAKSEHHHKLHTLNAENSLHDFAGAAVSEPNLYLQRSRSMNNLSRKKMWGHQHHKKHIKVDLVQEEEEEEKQAKEMSKASEEEMSKASVDTNNTDSISVNNDDSRSGSDSSNTIKSQPEPMLAAVAKSTQSKSGMSGNKGGKFKMKKRAKKTVNKKIVNRMKMQTKIDGNKSDSEENEESEAYSLPTTWINDELITLSEVEEDILLNKSLRKKQKSDTNDAYDDDDGELMRQLSLVLEQNNENQDENAKKGENEYK